MAGANRESTHAIARRAKEPEAESLRRVNFRLERLRRTSFLNIPFRVPADQCMDRANNTITQNGGNRFIPLNSWARQENPEKNFVALRIVTWPTILSEERIKMTLLRRYQSRDSKRRCGSQPTDQCRPGSTRSTWHPSIVPFDGPEHGQRKNSCDDGSDQR